MKTKTVCTAVSELRSYSSFGFDLGPESFHSYHSYSALYAAFLLWEDYASSAARFSLIRILFEFYGTERRTRQLERHRVRQRTMGHTGGFVISLMLFAVDVETDIGLLARGELRIQKNFSLSLSRRVS